MNLLRNSFFLAICWILHAVPAWAVRVAVFANDDPNLEAAVSEALSKEPGTEVLERSSLQALEAEVRLGRSLPRIEGADRVIFLEKQSDGTRAVRVAEAKSGALIHAATLPAMDEIQAAASILARLRPWLDHLPDVATAKFSILGLRCETDSPANRQKERVLNLALGSALQSRPGCLVLERWKLHDLVFEKSLLGTDDAFWKAARLLDGSIAEKNGQWTVRLRERIPGGGERTIETLGSAGDMPALASRLAELLLEQQPPPTADHAVEAKAYADEAKWLLKHGLKPEAAQAAETAMALGLEDPATEILRIRGYAESAAPLDLSRLSLGIATLDGVTVDPGKIETSIAMATTMCSLVTAYIAKHPMRTDGTRTMEDPDAIGVQSLRSALCALRAACLCGHAGKNPGAVADLRQAVRKQIQALQKLPLADPKKYYDLRPALYGYLINFAAFWNDTPQETLAFYEKILSPDFADACPDGMFLARSALRAWMFSPPAIPIPHTNTRNCSDRSPTQMRKLIDWKDPASPSVESIWKSYVEEKLASADPVIQADGLAFLQGSAATFTEQFALGPRLVEFLENNLSLFPTDNGRILFLQIRAGLDDAASNVGTREARVRMVNCYEKLLTEGKPLPPQLVNSVAMATPAGIQDIPIATGERLLAALNIYAKNLASPATQDREAIRSARNAILRSFPSLAPPPPQNSLKVTRAWIAAVHTPIVLPSSVRLDDATALWQDGRVWFTDVDRQVIWRVNPLTFATEVLQSTEAPEPQERSNTTFGGLNFSRPISRPALFDGKYFLPVNGGIRVYLPKENRWRSLNLPNASYSLWRAGNELYATFGNNMMPSVVPRSEGSGVYRIDSESETAELICNTRRRPALHPLDECAYEFPWLIVPASDGTPLVGLQGVPGRANAFHCIVTGTASEIIDRRLRPDTTAANGETMLVNVESRSHLRIRGIQFIERSGKMETLLWDPCDEIPAPSKPVWPMPDNLPTGLEDGTRKNYIAAMHRGTFYLLASPMATAPTDKGRTELLIFKRSAPEPTRINLDFVLAEDDEATLYRKEHFSGHFQNPSCEAYGLMVQDEGIVIAGRWMTGFWFIPHADIEQFSRSAPCAGE